MDPYFSIPVCNLRPQKMNWLAWWLVISMLIISDSHILFILSQTCFSPSAWIVYTSHFIFYCKHASQSGDCWESAMRVVIFIIIFFFTCNAPLMSPFKHTTCWMMMAYMCNSRRIHLLNKSGCWKTKNIKSLKPKHKITTKPLFWQQSNVQYST